MKLNYFLILLFIPLFCFSQKEANNWYFGYNAAITFQSGYPTALLDNAMNFPYGTSSISDSTGSLLFYTDGEFVYNRMHQQMPNGFGLLGFSHSQTSIIVKKPGSTNKYYIFTVGNAFSQPFIGLHYSIIDMDKQGGLGDVDNLFKNIPLLNSDLAVEKITAVKHADNNSVWVIVRNLTQPVNEYHAYLITSNGVNSQPKKTNCVSNIPVEESGSNRGQMKISPDSKYIISNLNNTVGGTEIGQFNNRSGVIENLFNFKQIELGLPWGVEYSSDSHFIYFTNEIGWINENKIVQYELSLLPDLVKFLDSEINIAIGGDALDLQMASDGKIYVARKLKEYLGVINNPSLKGVACDYDSLGVYLGGKICHTGLPQFIQTYFLRFEYNGQCAGDTFTFTPNFNPVPDSIHWDFGDPASGANNYSNELNPQHLYQNGGLYNVTAFVRYPDGRTETANRDVSVSALPEPLTLKDTTVCKGTVVQLQAVGDYDSYLWSTNQTTSSILVADTGSYWVEAINALGCTRRSTVHVGWFNLPQATLTSAVTPTTCGNSNGAIRDIVLSGGTAPYLINWIDNNGDTIGHDTALLNLPVGNYQLWVQDQSGCNYQLASYTINNIDSDLIIEDVDHSPNTWCNQLNAYLLVKVTEGLSDVLLYSVNNGSTYFDNQGSFTKLAAGSYIVMAKDNKGCEAVYDENPVIIPDSTGLSISGVSIEPETDNSADGKIIIVAIGDTLTYSLNGSAPQQEPVFRNLSSDYYLISVTDIHGCDSSFSVYIPQQSSQTIFAMAGDTMVCNGLRALEPLMVSNFKDITSFEITLTYNNQLLDVNGYFNVNPSILSGLQPVIYPGAGIIKLNWTGSPAITLEDSTLLLDLVLEAKNPGLSPMDWVLDNSQTRFINQFGASVNIETQIGNITIAPTPGIWSFYRPEVCQYSPFSQMVIPTGGTGTSSVTWYTPKGVMSGPEYKVDSAQLNDSGLYRVRVVDQLNCMVTDSIEVKVIAIPVPGIETQNDTIFFNEKFHLEANPGYYIYIWSTGENTNYMDGTEQGSYQLIIKTEEGCSDTTRYMLVNTAVELQMPNAFTPNADGINDCFKPLLDIEKVRHFNMLIYNRWGQRIFESNDPSKGWDARNVPAGIYNWHIIYSNRLGVPFQLRGSVALIK